MKGRIFLIQGGDELVEMEEQAYDSEDVLQLLLAKYPNLLAGDQMDAGNPRRWLLVSREMGVPAEEEGGDRWSLDHLFLDQDAIPTLVEVKRSTDTRIRREVVGQMLDYAANAVVYWPVETIRTGFEETCRQKGVVAAEELERFLGPEGSADKLREQVKVNLQAGRVRMVFVADEIPAELRRVVEFLNSQMDPAEVLAVEVKQYVGPGQESRLQTLVPRVIGQTEEAVVKKGTGGRQARQWDEASFFTDLQERHGAAADVARTLLGWAKKNGLRIWWGKGAKDGSFFPMLDHKGTAHFIVAAWTYGRVEILFQWMLSRPPFADEALRRELRDRLNKIPGVSIPSDAINRRPSVPLTTLASGEAVKQFLSVLDWFVQEIKEKTTTEA